MTIRYLSSSVNYTSEAAAMLALEERGYVHDAAGHYTKGDLWAVVKKRDDESVVVVDYLQEEAVYPGQVPYVG